MLKALRALLDPQTGAPDLRDPQQRVQLASAALWLEMVRADGKTSLSELEAVSKAVRSKFGLDEEQARALVQSARDAAARATDDFEFTSLINRHFTPGQKESVIEHLWQVAFADGALSAYEEHFVRPMHDLLYVSHGAYIAAKLRAERAVDK